MFEPRTLALMIPLVALSIPIFAIVVGALTKHQQRMAEIMHSSHAASSMANAQEFRNEIANLKEIVASQAIALDNLAQVQQRMLEGGNRSKEEPLAERLRQNS